MTTFTRDSLPFQIKVAASTVPDFGVSTDGTLEFVTGASFATGVTTVPPRSLTFTDPVTGTRYKIPAYVSGA
jgi:hypothetical protein